jgi:hypothetical protein
MGSDFGSRLAGWAVLFLLLLPAGDAQAISYESYRSDIARLETEARTDRDAAQAEARQTRQYLSDQRLVEQGFADKSAEHEASWRALAESARKNAARNRARAENYDRQSRDPLLSESFQAELKHWAERAREDEQADLALAAERDRDAAQRRSEAETHLDAVAEIDALIQRLDRIIADEERPPETATAPPPADAPPADTADGDGDAEEDDEEADFRVEDFLALWNRVDEPRFSMAIVQEDPEFEAYPHKLEAYTEQNGRTRVWKGNYTSFPKGHSARAQNARIELRYTPQPGEMNPELPDWVAAAIDGQLEWRLEIDEAGSAVDPRISVKWYRGEVRWTEGEEQRAWIEGDGVPLVFDMEPNYGVQIEELSRPTIGFVLANTVDYDPIGNPLQSLMTGQQFRVRATLPAEMAREQGNTLTVTIKSLKSGDSDTLVLEGGGGAGLRPVTYTNAEAVAIADCHAMLRPPRNPPFMSWQWLMNNTFGEGDAGDCLDISFENGEEVEVGFDGGFQRVVMYESWVQAGLARHAVAVKRLRTVYFSLLEKGAADGDLIEQKLRMLVNYEEIYASDKLTDVHRYALGELYFGTQSGPARFAQVMTHTHGEPPSDGSLGLLLQRPADIEWWYGVSRRSPAAYTPDENWFNPLMKAYLEGLTGEDLTPDAHTAGDSAISWTSDAEKAFVRETLRRTSEQYLSRAIQETAQNFAFGLYDGYSTATPAGALYLVVTGKDHFGRRTQKWERVLAGVGLASGAVLELSGLSAATRLAEPAAQSSRLGRGVAREATLVSDGARSVSRIADDIVDMPGLPAGMKEAQRRQTALRFAADPQSDGACPCAKRAKQPRLRASVQSQAPKLDLFEYWGAEEYMERAYPKGTKILDELSEPLLAKQSPDRGSCNAMASIYLLWKKLKRLVSEDEALEQINQVMYDQLFEGDAQRMTRRRGDRTLDYILEGPGEAGGPGVDQLAIRDFLRTHGGKVAEVDRGWNSFVKLRHIWSAIENGWGVKVVVKLDEANFGPKAYHAVVVDGLRVKKTANGFQIRGVRIYDSNIGRIIEVPARKFNDMLAREITGYGILTLVRFDGSA